MQELQTNEPQTYLSPAVWAVLVFLLIALCGFVFLYTISSW